MASSRNLRVLHVVDQLALGGAERMAVDLVNLLPAQGIEALLCTTRVGGPLESQLAPGVEYVPLNRRSRIDLRAAQRLIRLVKSRSIDIIHTHGIGSMYFIAACRLIGSLRCKHLFHNHRPDIDLASDVPMLMKIASRGGFDVHVGVDKNLCDWIEKRVGVSPNRVFLVRNGVDLKRFTDVQPTSVKELYSIPSSSLALVMIANFRPEKDHPTLLQALAQCRCKHRIKALLIGKRAAEFSEYYELCVRMVSDLALQDVVEFVGERSDVPGFLFGCDAGVLSSRDESGPLALLEYMAARLPYVVTARGQITAAVEGSGTGLVVPAGDPQTLGQAIDSLCGMDPRERERIGQAGRELVSREFSQESTVRAIVSIYEKLVPQGM